MTPESLPRRCFHQRDPFQEVRVHADCHSVDRAVAFVSRPSCFAEGEAIDPRSVGPGGRPVLVGAGAGPLEIQFSITPGFPTLPWGDGSVCLQDDKADHRSLRLVA